MIRRTIGFKVGIVTFCIHLILAVFAFITFINSKSSTAGLVFIYFFFLDAPIHFLITMMPFSVFDLSRFMPLIIYGVLGSALWFQIPWLTDRLVTRVFPNVTRAMRWISVIGLLPFLMVGFILLGSWTTALSIKKERPDELRNLLGSPSSDYLTQRVVFDDISFGNVTSITRGSFSPNTGPEMILGCHRGIVFLNDRYEVQKRIEFSDCCFQTVYPVHTAEDSTPQFIAYKFFEHAALYDYNGIELWKAAGTADEGRYVDGVQSGDIDKDGKQEYAVYHRYRDGIMLIDESGKTLWKHPVYALGHLEMKDVRGNGKEEIIFSNSNNANLLTVFRTIDADGSIVDELEISTASYEFSIIGWPVKKIRPNILLTEENMIRIVDMKGSTVVKLDAPGCRTFGKVKAATVRFRKDEPAFLAVRKILHPDLAVLFVYDANGSLVFQSVQVIEGSLQPSLAAVPVDETGNERLLVAHVHGYGTRIIEYSLAQQY